jgi:hypothetical protein
MDSGRHISKHRDRRFLAQFETLYPIGATRSATVRLCSFRLGCGAQYGCTKYRARPDDLSIARPPVD